MTIVIGGWFLWVLLGVIIGAVATFFFMAINMSGWR